MSEEKKLNLPQEKQPNMPNAGNDGSDRNSASAERWSELVGLTAEEAEKKIKEERPGLQVMTVPSNSCVTMDFRQNRVRLFVDSSGKVERPPRIG